MSHMDQVQIARPIATYPRKPIPPRRWTTAQVYIDFFGEYSAFALDILIDNLDATNTLAYYLNDALGAAKTIAAGATITITDTVIESICIIPNGTTGTGELSANVIEDKILIPSLGGKR